MTVNEIKGVTSIVRAHHGNMLRRLIGLRVYAESCLTAAARWSSSGPRVLTPTDKNVVTQQSGSSVHTAAAQEKITDITDPAPDIEDYMKHPDFFGVRDLVRLEDLFAARVHLGHKEGTRNDFMVPYIFGNRLGVDIIDLEKTVPMFQDALNFLAHIVFRDGIVLFVSKHKETVPLVESLALETGEFAHCREWRRGNFVNKHGALGAVARLPDVVVLLSTNTTAYEQHPVVVEAAKVAIPTIGIVDTSNDPRLVTFPIPGNDDTRSSVQLYCNLFAKAVKSGKAKKQQHQAELGTD